MFESLEPIEIRLLQTASIIVFFTITKAIINRVVNKTLLNFDFGLQRKRIALKATNFIIFILSSVSIVAVWGLKGSQVLTFLTSILAVIGVAFMAQWSLLSNITAGLILFFGHPLKIGDYIQIQDKDFPMEGQIQDISLFFLFIRTTDHKTYTIPNAVVVQKTLTILKKEKEETE
ncbi:MAG: mechanosensitive ion channel [Bacteroidetes bacterium]|nr:mechanosensitive ion channel [Bacteroidota bacterium]